jgi:chromatin remodeling complex protein RSC6
MCPHAQEATMAEKHSTETKHGGAGGAARSRAGLQKPVQPSRELAEIVGSAPLPRTQVISKTWDYIRAHKLQNPQNKREIIADGKLKAVFGRDKVNMFEMNKLLSPHLS